MTFNLTRTEDGYIKVEVTGVYEDRQQSELLDPGQARDAGEKLQELADSAANSDPEQ